MASAVEANSPSMADPAPATVAERNSDDMDIVDEGPMSPTSKQEPAIPAQPIEAPTVNNTLDSFNMRADPDAQATVSDYIDFVDHLPSDIRRSLTLIGKLDQTYADSSIKVNKLTSTWSKLPTLPADQRPLPAQLRAEISENLNRAVSSRTSSYAEACRMSDYVNRHVNRAKTILAKLQTMRENYPTEEQRSPVQTRSPQMSRTPKVTLRVDKDGQKVRGPPRITVPGEVLAPYDIDFNAYSSFSEESSDEDEISVSPARMSPAPRIKLVKTPKVPKDKVPKAPRQPRQQAASGMPMLSTSTALAKLQPPPENAVPGSHDAPWLQLTAYELARLRKRMKKNAVWSPSDTMIARELKNLGRGIEAYRAAERKAKDEGRPFEPSLPAPVVDADSGVQHPPEGAISAEALGAEEVQLSNRGMKLNEAKKLKREAMSKLAGDDAEESTRKMMETARQLLNHEASPSVAGSVQGKGSEAGPSQSSSQSQSKAPKKPREKKRKRDSESEVPATVKAETIETGNGVQQSIKPQVKRTKTETPVPPPQIPRPTSLPPPVETPVPPPQVVQSTPVVSTTPVPLPVQPSVQPSPNSTASAVKPAISPTTGTSPAPVAMPMRSATPVPAPANNNNNNAANTTTTVPTKPPAETPIPPPAKTSTTPILPPTRDLGKRETRKDHKSLQPIATNATSATNATNTTNATPKQPSSRGNTPVTTPVPEPQSATSRRPVSRGKAGSQEPPTTLAVERPRRASTARNTPVPPGTSPADAVGSRKVPPKKRPRGPNKSTSSKQVEPEAEVELDEDGNVIDPDEPRYCMCNRVSFGTMIQCDNVDVSRTDSTSIEPSTPSPTATPASHSTRSNERRKVIPDDSHKLTGPRTQNCKQEWFHLECVGLNAIPARTTKWYCPDCRVALNIGGRGEVTSRGVKL
ncbi:PHD finger protein ING2 [Apiospora hydei]|uniref:PHD finger protein ING2 n=1 Tax=Apiospora hydei TaxID=1337664 RepID=A0ABR1WY54_9PEZI